jgi:hypothetical protein
VGEGSARIVGKNRVSARQRALQRAIRDALRQELVAIGIAIPSAPQLALARRYERGYRVLSEAHKDGRFIVTVRVNVDASFRVALRPKTTKATSRNARKPLARLELTGSAFSSGLVQAFSSLGVQLKSKCAAPLFVVVAQATITTQPGVRGVGLAGCKLTLALSIKSENGQLLKSAPSITSDGYGKSQQDAGKMAMLRASRKAVLALSSVISGLLPRATSGSELLLTGLANYAELRQICAVVKRSGADCRVARIEKKTAQLRLGQQPLDPIITTLLGHKFSGMSVKLSAKTTRHAKLHISHP